jgi:rieske iron-sulfur protein
MERRTLLCGCASAALAASRRRANADETDDPDRMARPRTGDLLVYAEGDHSGQPIKPPALQLGGPQVMAWAFDPQKKVPRDGSRLNMILLIRLDPSSMASDEKSRAADGVVAFSAICTHQGCTVTDWLTAKRVMQCPCHQSEYNPRSDAAVVAGPAPRPLPALPLKLDGGALQVAAPFTDRVGGEKTTG